MILTCRPQRHKPQYSAAKSSYAKISPQWLSTLDLCCTANDTADQPNDLGKSGIQHCALCQGSLYGRNRHCDFQHANDWIVVSYVSMPMQCSTHCSKIFVIALSIQEQPIVQMLFAVMQQVHTCLRSDTAATGSVAATMAPNRKL